ncbi:MAG TPA: hypothetical protein DHV44_04765 [Providencia sp.]|nr:hypothetical protein [Providencia rettgeri]HCI95593.1 hypothetical protein [Providencia sp.]
MTKRILSIAVLFAVAMQSYALELKVPIGARGYIDEVMPPVATSTAYLYTGTELRRNDHTIRYL